MEQPLILEHLPELQPEILLELQPERLQRISKETTQVTLLVIIQETLWAITQQTFREHEYPVTLAHQNSHEISLVTMLATTVVNFYVPLQEQDRRII